MVDKPSITYIQGPMLLNFFVRNLRIFVVSSSVCPWQDLPSLFEKKAGSLPWVKHLSGDPLSGRLRPYLQTLD